ncbi:Por secretion system C-terminal sorting domain-containing protein [Algibacter lectus]|uniref:leucine-rich repeat domain-containing protein n=1 Tax=Algibacter lectus TaxID=221126 RepID=UPI0008F03CEB|nr:leucine-rich repeat domain-containing protein [Algibacter lectus]SFB93748.1 Por secretion system C-terminal sorting domain-containing protein [Algibacter lectus]
MKKQLLFIAALVMCVTQSFAQDFVAGNLNFSIQTNGTEVSCKGFVAGMESASLVIPEKVTDPATSTEYNVAVIAGGAFYNNTGINDQIITSISLPGSIKLVGVNAFRELLNLTTVTFAPSTVDVSLLRFEDAIFWGCTSLTSIDLTGTNINFGRGIGTPASKSGRNLFRDCTSLTSFTLKNNTLTSRVYTGAFSGCTSLETVDFSGTAITTFSPNAFLNCTALKTLYLGADAAPNTVNATAFGGITAPISGGQLFVPTATGVTNYTDATNFEWESYFTILSGTTLSTDRIVSASNFKLYPNPATKSISVSKAVVSAKIYSMLGKEIKTFTNQKEFDVSNLSKGVYLFKAKFENNTTETIRFVKQ